MPRPPQLDREMVLAAAVELAERRGVDAISLRAVADRLEVTPMALYRHVGDKQALLDGMIERLLLELPLPDPAAPWRDQLGVMATGLRATAGRHPGLFPLLLQRPAATTGALRVREAVYDALRASGVPEAMVPRTERILSTFLLGFAASEAGGRFSVDTVELDADLAWFETHVLGPVITGAATGATTPAAPPDHPPRS